MDNKIVGKRPAARGKGLAVTGKPTLCRGGMERATDVPDLWCPRSSKWFVIRKPPFTLSTIT